MLQNISYLTEKVHLAQNGDKEALEELLLNRKDSLYRIAYAITQNEENSKDAIGNMVLKVCENINKIKKPEYFYTWMTKILLNECFSILKKNKKVVTMDESLENNLSTNEENDLAIAIREIVKKLNKKHKEIVILYYFDDYSVEEISEILKVSQGTIKSRLSRAREELKSKGLEKLL